MSSTGKPYDRKTSQTSKGPDNYENGYARGFDEGYKVGYRDGFSNGARNNNPIAHVEEQEPFINQITNEQAGAITDDAGNYCGICRTIVMTNMLQPKLAIDDSAKEDEWVIIWGHNPPSKEITSHLNYLSTVKRTDIIEQEEYL